MSVNINVPPLCQSGQSVVSTYGDSPYEQQRGGLMNVIGLLLLMPRRAQAGAAEGTKQRT